VGVPFALFALVLAATLATLPARLYGDDVFFVWCIVRDRVFTPHFLYMPLARPWTTALGSAGVDPFVALRALAAVGMSAGVALLAAAALRRGFGVAASVALALFVATSNAPFFFARAPEVHGLQLAAFGLLALVLAGMRADARPTRMLSLALAFGVAVGAHKTSALLLPGVLCAYAFATAGRARARRAADAAWFALGGALAVGAMAAFQHAATGTWFSDQESASYWTGGFGDLAGNLAPLELARYAAEAWIAPAFASAMLAAAAAGALLLARPRAFVALLVTALPYAVVLPLFGWTERGAYLIVLLPIAVLALAAPLKAGAITPNRAGLALAATAVLAGFGALFTPDELLTTAGTGGLCLALGAAFALGLAAAPRLRPDASAPSASTGELAAVVLALAACQLVGSARDLRDWSRETPLRDWGRDAVAVAGPDARLIVATFHEKFLLLLLDREWPEPYRGTWDYANELGTLGPTAIDASALFAQLPAGVAAQLAEGRRVFAAAEVFETLASEPLRGPSIRALRERFRLVPADRGSFRGFELRAKSD